MKGIAALSFAAVASASFSTETIHGDSAPVLSSLDADSIPDSYIIKFKDHVDEASVSDHHLWVQDVHETGQSQYNELRKRDGDDLVGQVFSGLKHKFAIGDEFKGYAGHFHPDVVEQLRNHPDVSHPLPAQKCPETALRLPPRSRSGLSATWLVCSRAQTARS